MENIIQMKQAHFSLHTGSQPGGLLLPHPSSHNSFSQILNSLLGISMDLNTDIAMMGGKSAKTAGILKN